MLEGGQPPESIRRRRRGRLDALPYATVDAIPIDVAGRTGDSVLQHTCSCHTSRPTPLSTRSLWGRCTSMEGAHRWKVHIDGRCTSMEGAHRFASPPLALAPPRPPAKHKKRRCREQEGRSAGKKTGGWTGVPLPVHAARNQTAIAGRGVGSKPPSCATTTSALPDPR